MPLPTPHGTDSGDRRPARPGHRPEYPARKPPIRSNNPRRKRHLPPQETRPALRPATGSKSRCSRYTPHMKPSGTEPPGTAGSPGNQSRRTPPRKSSFRHRPQGTDPASAHPFHTTGDTLPRERLFPAKKAENPFRIHPNPFPASHAKNFTHTIHSGTTQ